ncbi:MAG: succinate dehydrogenase cytochrome b subunit [Planctomycetes bacterium]|nr:succinate dehydrogenase cytochrome b subunit [Planctomycetota bacterium]
MLTVFEAVRSSVGKKILMAVTALSLVMFVITHLLGNLKLYSRDSTTFNLYAHKLDSLGGILYLAESGLLLLFLTHITIALSIFLTQRKARPDRYYMHKRSGKTGYNYFSSTTMIYTGVFVLVFLVLHLLHFKLGQGIKDGYTREVGGEVVRDLHRLVLERFQNPWWVSFYVVSIAMLGIHLSHGVWSAFQSLGASHPRYTPLIYGSGILVALMLSLGFLILPIFIYINW